MVVVVNLGSRGSNAARHPGSPRRQARRILRQLRLRHVQQARTRRAEHASHACDPAAGTSDHSSTSLTRAMTRPSDKRASMSSPARTWLEERNSLPIRAANHDSVATFERGEWAHRVQRSHREIDTRLCRAHAGVRSSSQAHLQIRHGDSTAREFSPGARISIATRPGHASARSSFPASAVLTTPGAARDHRVAAPDAANARLDAPAATARSATPVKWSDVAGCGSWRQRVACSVALQRASHCC